MIDMHYDLLTIAYIAYKKNKLQEFKDYYTNIYKNNIKGGIVNLYFMSHEEMEDELNISKTQPIDVIDMFKTSISIIDKSMILPKGHQFIFGIEGCDYINDIEDLDQLYNMGLRSINIVWNEKNKFGCGIRDGFNGLNPNEGLTPLGVNLINKAIDLGIGIDLSHANDKTFFDIINVIKERKYKGDEVIVYASHSNSRALCNRPRNLTNEQMKALHDVNGTIGLLANYNFVTSEKELTHEQYKYWFIKNIKHAVSIVGIDNVTIATDDMGFMKMYGINNDYDSLNIFDLENVKSDLTTLLFSYGFNEDEAYKIIYQNGANLINKLKN